MAVAFVWSSAAYLSLAFFLVVVGLGLGWALLKLGNALGRLSAFIRGAQDELLPVVQEIAGSVERVNAQLDKLDQATDSALDAVEAIDHSVRAVTITVRRPAVALAGLSSGLRHGFATLRARRDWRAAVESGKEAAARRRADIVEELREPVD